MKEDLTDKFLALLKEGDVSEYNKFREGRISSHYQNFSDADLPIAKVSGANLSKAASLLLTSLSPLSGLFL
jgi:hypothetical protein